MAIGQHGGNITSYQRREIMQTLFDQLTELILLPSGGNHNKCNGCRKGSGTVYELRGEEFPEKAW